MGLVVAAILAGAIDPLKMLMAIVIALTLRKRNWFLAGLAGIMLVAYVCIAATMSNMSNGQVTIHFVSCVLLIGLAALSARFWGGLATGIVGGVLVFASAGLIWLVVSQPMHASELPHNVGSKEINLTSTELDQEEEQVIAPARPKMNTGLNIYSEFGKTSTPADYQRDMDIQREANEPLGEGNWLNPVVAPGYTVARSFMHGENIAVNIGKEIYRKATAGPSDPAWRAGGYNAWIDQNRSLIPASQDWLYAGTGSRAEAEMLLADTLADRRAMLVNAARK